MADETKNVKISIEDRINTQLGSLTIDWPGTEFDSDGVTEWIAPQAPDFNASPSRLSDRFELWTLSVNCFARTGPSGETTHRVHELVDLVLGAFDKLDLAIKDWADTPATPTLFFLRFGPADVTALTPPGEAGKFTQQMNVSIDGHLIT